MPQISSKTKDKIAEQILHYLFAQAPSAQFTNSIANSLARDEEFIKFLLSELEKKQLVIKITKGPEGQQYSRRQRWRLSNQAYEAYKKITQPKQPSYPNNDFSSV